MGKHKLNFNFFPIIMVITFLSYNRQLILSESIEDIETYLWVTDDVLNQIRTLNPEDNDEIKKAQQIVNRIYCRDFYKRIGEKRVKWKDDSKPTQV